MADDEPRFFDMIRDAFYQNRLPETIADALGKNAVLMMFIDVQGRILTLANNRANVPTAVRDRTMILQLCELIDKSMKDMMKQAGKEQREQEASGNGDKS